jgi:photosystem II stability/assembly factor-like uncharacterized protein
MLVPRMDDPSRRAGRAHRALALMGLALVALAAAAAISMRSTAVARPSPPVPAVTSLDWLSARVGWVVLTDAQSRSVLFHTVDGGRRWERQFATIGTPMSVRFVDGTHGLMTEPTPYPGANPTVLRSDDAGAHWSPISPPFELGPRPTLPFFLDPDHGWLMVRTGRSDTVEDVDILRTVDGGLSWARVLSVDPISWISHGVREEGLKRWVWFRSQLDGWLGTLEPDGSVSVSVTHDGGADWRRVPLPEPPGGPPTGDTLVVVPPRIEDAGAGALVLIDTTRLARRPAAGRAAPAPPPVVVYRAADGGETWTDPTPVPAGVEPRQTDPAFVDGANGWLAAGRWVWLTADSGATWTRRGPLPGNRSLVELAPVDAAVAVGQAASGPAFGPGSPWSLVVTEDGGRTWRELSSPRM